MMSFLAFISLSILKGETEFRTFRSKKGSGLEAKISKLGLNQVTLTTRDERIVKVDWDELSEVDREYLRKRYQSENPVGLVTIGSGTLMFTGSAFLEVLFIEAGWTLTMPQQKNAANPFGPGLENLDPNVLNGLAAKSQQRIALLELAPAHLGGPEDLKKGVEWVKANRDSALKSDFRLMLVDPFYRRGEDYYDAEGEKISAAEADRHQKTLRSRIPEVPALPVREVLAKLKGEAKGGWPKEDWITPAILGAGVVFAAITDEAPQLELLSPKKGGNAFLPQEGHFTALGKDEVKALAMRLHELTRQHLAAP